MRISSVIGRDRRRQQLWCQQLGRQCVACGRKLLCLFSWCLFLVFRAWRLPSASACSPGWCSGGGSRRGESRRWHRCNVAGSTTGEGKTTACGRNRIGRRRESPIARLFGGGERETQLADGGSVPPGSYGLSVCLSRETLFAQGLFGYWQGGRGRLKSEREYTRG